MSGESATRFQGLRRIAPQDVSAAAPTPVDASTRARAGEIVDAVRGLGSSSQSVNVVPVHAGVLDLSNRGDVESVAEHLAGKEVHL